MKKYRFLLLLCLVAILLAGCGTKASRSVDSLIEAIGPVDASCGPVVDYVRDAYDALTQEEKDSLKNYDLLLASEAGFVDALIDEAQANAPHAMQTVLAAREAYERLLPEAQALVTGMTDLDQAEADCALGERISAVCGIWVNEVLGSAGAEGGSGLIHSYGLDETHCEPARREYIRFELREDGTVCCADAQLGTWELSADHSAVEILGSPESGENLSGTLQILEEGGFTKLVGDLFGNQPFGYVKETEYAAAFAEKYAALPINRENILEYIGDPVKIGTLENEKGKKCHGYVYESRVFDQGLHYMGSSCVIRVDYTHGGKADYFWLDHPAVSLTGLKMKDVLINREAPLSGEIFYVRDEYVADNYINEDGFRVLELTNGVSLVFNGYDQTLNTFWGNIDASYEDYRY